MDPMNSLEDWMTGESMSRRDVYAQRRFWFLVVPAATVGMIVYLASFAVTASINGLGLLALLFAGGVLSVGAWDISGGAER